MILCIINLRTNCPQLFERTGCGSNLNAAICLPVYVTTTSYRMCIFFSLRRICCIYIRLYIAIFPIVDALLKFFTRGLFDWHDLFSFIRDDLVTPILCGTDSVRNSERRMIQHDSVEILHSIWHALSLSLQFFSSLKMLFSTTNLQQNAIIDFYLLFILILFICNIQPKVIQLYTFSLKTSCVR